LRANLQFGLMYHSPYIFPGVNGYLGPNIARP
jgi:hypothetical protein